MNKSGLLNITLVIACRNEMPQQLPKWDCPVIIVDDHSDNSQFTIYISQLGACKNVKVVSNPYPQGKKYALKYGIEQAETEFVYLTDADTILPKEIPPFHTDADLNILPLQMDAQNSLLGQLQQVEYTTLQTATMYSAKKGKPIMCSGANLIVRRARWLECFNDLHTELPSGDDMFLLQAFKQKNLIIKAIYGEGSIATITAQPSLSKLFKQRMRWAGKTPQLTDPDIRKCGILVGTLNILSILVPPIWLLKFAGEMLLWHRRKQFGFNCKAKWYVLLLLSILYPWYMLICLVGGQINKQQW